MTGAVFGQVHFLWQARYLVKFEKIAGARNVVFSIQSASGSAKSYIRCWASCGLMGSW